MQVLTTFLLLRDLNGGKSKLEVFKGTCTEWMFSGVTVIPPPPNTVPN